VFVRAREGEWASLGLGKQLDRQGELCSVEYFDAPTSDPIVHRIATATLEPVTLPEQTRVYFFNNALGAWEIGRLLADHNDTQIVKFPNGQTRQLAVSDVFVRWARPIADPTPFLGGKVNETPRFADSRNGFVRSLLAQRAAGMGMSALTSSAIELEAHQVEVVRRILQDPVQRYLLADEVGLGKTVEAGILIRQCILDAGGNALVLVIAPEALVPQWRTELETKFFLGHCLDTWIHVLALGDSERIKPLLGKTTMLVIDEAHHLTGHRLDISSDLYGEIAAVVNTIERVLLLSATPALHNERGFLKMLHLLDPDTYPLTDEPGFRRRIESRQALAEIVAGLTPENSLYLDYTLDQLAERFPDDALLREQAQALRAITDTIPTEDDPALIQAVERVRAHVSEVYRLHRRMLRHRRRSISGLTPGRSGATSVDYRSPDMARLFEAIEDWRFDEATASDREMDDKIRADRVRICAQVLDRVVQYALTGSGVVGFLERQPHIIGDAERFGRIARQVGSVDIFEARTSALISTLKLLLAPKQQFVVFCSDAITADALAAALGDQLNVPVDRHDPEDGGWLAFNLDASRPILVCDRRAEEGLNLQGGRKTVIHYDLPLNPNRIEQRIGRADRYGSGDAVKSIVLNCLDNPIENAWIKYLDKGLRVFERSVASLQYLIEDTTRDLAASLFAEGAEALADLTEKSAGEDGIIEREMRNIDQQDALDALGTPTEDMFEALTNVDDDWRAIERDTSTWFERTLQFSRITESVEGRADTNGDAPFRYRYATSNQHTLIPLETFYARCQSAVDHSPAARLARMVLTVPLTYRRRTALGRQGRAMATHLLRYGDPFVTGMWEITQGDDRGRSTALWRHMPGYQSEGVADVFFRFDFIVEADVVAARGILADANRLTDASAAAIVRRGDMALPPFSQTIWLDQELARVEDPEILSRLNLPYRPDAVGQGGRDFNLNPRRWRQMRKLDVPQLPHWAELCLEARTRAEACLRRLPSLTGGLERAVRHASAVDFSRIGQLRARAERSINAADSDELKLEESLSNRLMGGIHAPHIRVDAILACFLTGDSVATATIDGGA
jgi:ATP-dependent helicase HepA